MISKLKVLRSHGKQHIKDLAKIQLPEIFRGRPEVSGNITKAMAEQIAERCPSGAFTASPIVLDLGRCLFCGECERMAPKYVKFTNDFRMTVNSREDLMIKPGYTRNLALDSRKVREDVYKTFRRSLKLRQVCAGGDNASELELSASGNVNFDFGRYGIDFVASPRHADGVVITGPITKAMAEPLDICLNSISEPRVVIIVGTDAISGGMYADSPALNREFFERYTPDLWIAGHPIHPLTFIDGVRSMLNKGVRK